MFEQYARQSSHRTTGHSGCVRRARGFTLLELALVMAIVSLLLTLSAFTFRGVRDTSTLAQSKNMILAAVAITRNYAVANHIETMLVVNPYNGRFEVWHLNPPAQGGAWDPFSGGVTPPFTDGYAFAPIMDPAAGLPLDGNRKPLAAVFPVDYDDPAYRPLANTEPNVDNLIWTAFCFDENGRLVTRTRRIATRSYRYRDGSLRPAAQRNRVQSESPDLTPRDAFPPQPMVTFADTAITSTRGFVVCDWTRAQAVVGAAPTPVELVAGLLRETRPGRRLSNIAETVLLDRFSGQQLVGDK